MVCIEQDQQCNTNSMPTKPGRGSQIVQKSIICIFFLNLQLLPLTCPIFNLKMKIICVICNCYVDETIPTLTQQPFYLYVELGAPTIWPHTLTQLLVNTITLFRSIKVFCGIILSVPQNTFMDLNNVMRTQLDCTKVQYGYIYILTHTNDV
jgi:hypothetical protein